MAVFGNKSSPHIRSHLGDGLNDCSQGEGLNWLGSGIVVVLDQIVVDSSGLGSGDRGKHTLISEQVDTGQELNLIEGVVVVLVHAIEHVDSSLSDLENGQTLVEGVLGFLFRKNAIVVHVVVIESGHDSVIRHIVEHVDLGDSLDKVVTLHFCQITVHVVRVESLPEAIEMVLRDEVRLNDLPFHIIGVLAADQVSIADIMPADFFESDLAVAVLVNESKESVELRLSGHLQVSLDRWVIEIDSIDSDRWVI